MHQLGLYDNCSSDSIISSLETKKKELSKYYFVVKASRRAIQQWNISASLIVVGYNQVCKNIFIPKQAVFITRTFIRNIYSKESLILKLFWDVCSMWRKTKRKHWLETKLTEPWHQRQELLVMTSQTSSNHEPRKCLLWFRNCSVAWRKEKNSYHKDITKPFVRECNKIAYKLDSLSEIQASGNGQDLLPCQHIIILNFIT